jgi:hypothetical protein
MAALRDLAAHKLRAHRTQFLGAEFQAITLNSPPALIATARTSALTDNFLPVELSATLPANRLVQIRIAELTPENILLATPVHSAASSDNSHSRICPVPSEPVLENAF